jgi:hypothetical protein
MKKLFILLILATISIMSYSQDKSKTLGLQDYVYEYTLGASDTVSNNDTLWSAELLTNKIAPLLYNIKVKLTKVSGTPKSTVYLQGKLFSDDTWVNITSLTYGGTTADTTINWSNIVANTITGTNTVNADSTITVNNVYAVNAKYYRYLRVYNDARGSVAGKYRISAIKVKLWNE